ncbi:unnamed protein product [Litomosoides sigmodontis]|uniref:Uncharacterized protein n=1 Tax=Litomosoides sigmodontis TaxID=42156 RepID=A0A3P6U5Z4_LITSI|nr:unnamed protein product [Litomosoides sigmodontis]
MDRIVKQLSDIHEEIVTLEKEQSNILRAIYDGLTEIEELCILSEAEVARFNVLLEKACIEGGKPLEPLWLFTDE